MQKLFLFIQSIVQRLGVIYVGSAILLFAISLHACRKKQDVRVQPVIVVQNFYPNSGKGGTLVNIIGSGFSYKLEENKVLFAGHPADVLSVDSAVMVVRAPSDGETGSVTVSNGGSQKVDAGKYTYQDLTITHVDPLNGPAGAHITIYGSGFTSVVQPATVTINGKNAVVSRLNDTTIVVEIPVDAGNGPIEVFVDGKSVKGPDFHFQSILAVKPLSGGKGTRVRITGAGFGADASVDVVDFNGKVAKILDANPTSILVEAPDGVESGPLAVTVNGQRATGPNFTALPFPVINEVSPLSGFKGVEMTITGSYFSDSLNEDHVFINGKEMTLEKVNSSLIKLMLPAGIGNGPIVLSVNDQQVTGPGFKEQALYIDSISPDNGLAADMVTISGYGFAGTISGNTVTFNGVTATITAATPTSLQVIVPNNVSTGAVKVAVAGLDALAPVDFKRAGILTVARGLSNTSGIAADNNGNLYVIQYPGKIIKISPQGAIADFVGSSLYGFTDGQGAAAAFYFTSTSQILFDHSNSFYVTDIGNKAIRRVSLSGAVTTIRQNVTSSGPLQLSPDGMRIVTIDNVSTMVQISLDGKTMQAVVPVSSFNFGLTNSFVLDKSGGVYYTNAYNSDYYSVEGDVSHNPVTAPEVNLFHFYNDLFTLLADIDGKTIIALQAFSIMRIDMPSGGVSTIMSGSSGNQDGNFRVAQLPYPGFDNIPAVMAADGTLYFITSDGVLRKVLFR